MLLSFDGGGSKTAVQLCDLQGRVLAEETIDTIDYGQIGIPQVAARLKAGLNAVLRRSGKEEKALAGITVGLPRLGRSQRKAGIWSRRYGRYSPPRLGYSR